MECIVRLKEGKGEEGGGGAININFGVHKKKSFSLFMFSKLHVYFNLAISCINCFRVFMLCTFSARP